MNSAEKFTSLFESAPAYRVVAPGRVNLIGEHTDYNDGFVLPMAIDRATRIALRPRTDRRVVLHSVEYGEVCEFDLDALEKAEGWGEYPKGVAWAMMEQGLALRGWEGAVECDVPMGAGLSSSASFELAVARAFAQVSDLPWDPAQMARIGQAAENHWVGVNCGIMDQMISACGQDGHAVLLDCRSLETRAVPLPSHTVVVILDTGTRRGLVDSAYNERRAQCEEAARLLGVTALRDADDAALAAIAATMDPVTHRRARHVITENRRTEEAAAAMVAGEGERFGRLMNESHVSLRDDFEVSSEALNVMVEAAQAQPGCLGARMTGAGFGGCAVALVEDADPDTWMAAVQERYSRTTSHTPALYCCRASQGAHILDDSVVSV